MNALNVTGSCVQDLTSWWGRLNPQGAVFRTGRWSNMTCLDDVSSRSIEMLR
jgi:hypothetical protein